MRFTTTCYLYILATKCFCKFSNIAVEYLNELRMEKAIEYARNGAKMYVAASEVGIPDPNYFSRCFKKYTGVSYSEYT